VHHASCAKDITVDCRHGRCNHHDVEKRRSGGNPQVVEDLDERAALAADLLPWIQRHQHEEGKHVKQQDAQRHGVDGTGNHALGVARFPGRDADDFDAAKGEHHHGQRGDEPADAVGHETAIGPEIAHAADTAPGHRANAEQHDAEARQNHRDDGTDLEQRQPELQLTEDFDTAQVECADQKDDAQHPDPAGYIGEPEAHVDAERRDIGQTDDDHFEGVGPAEDKSRQWTQIGGCVLAE
nr:hypothetical protein [Tanacetum cinerariifolium]